MKSSFKAILLLTLSILAISCQEDEDKNIQTDLSIEANQLFRISISSDENLYFGLLRFEDFENNLFEELPGCPTIVIANDVKKITLTFDPEKPCTQSGLIKRKGKLILQYPLLNTPAGSWTLSYQDYLFQKDTIQGTRVFHTAAVNQISETFTDLKIISNQGVSATFSGTLNHTVIKESKKIASISSTGSISGVNPVGRLFTIDVSSPKQTWATCFSQNEVLPISGKETWTIARGKNQKVTHTMSYEQTEPCTSTAIVKLSDGRDLQVAF